MATNYVIPPWLHGVSAGEIGSLFAGGLKAGLSAAEEQARLNLEAQAKQASLNQAANEASQRFAMEQQRLQAEQEQWAMKSQIQQQANERDAALQSQKIEMEKAYHEQMAGLRQMQLQDTHQKTQMAIEKASSQFAAQQEYQQRLAQGEDQASLVLELGPAMGNMGGPMSTAMRESMPAPDPVHAMDVPGAPGYFQVPSPTGRGYNVKLKHPDPDDVKAMTPTAASAMMGKLPELTQIYGTNWVNDIGPKLQKRVMEGLTGKATPSSGGTSQAIPPVNQRRVGQIYDTPKGPHEWTEQGWRKPTPTDEQDGSEPVSDSPEEEQEYEETLQKMGDEEGE
jgi:hypothetical protein